MQQHFSKLALQKVHIVTPIRLGPKKKTFGNKQNYRAGFIIHHQSTMQPPHIMGYWLCQFLTYSYYMYFITNI